MIEEVAMSVVHTTDSAISKRGVPVDLSVPWFAPEDIKEGRKLHEQIGEAIRFHEKLLLGYCQVNENSSGDRR